MNYRQLLSNYPIIKKLSLIQFIAYFGAWFSNVAIYSMMVDFGASAFTVSLIAAMHLIPAVVQAPFSGAVIDSLKIKPLMITLLCIELTMTLLFLTIHSLDDTWLLMILLFIRMSAASMFFTSEMSLLPKIIVGKSLQKANELHSVIWSFTFTAGMAVGGIVVTLWGTATAFLIDASFFVAALSLFFSIDFEIKAKQTKQKLSSMIKDGFIYIKNNKLALHLIILHGSVGLTAFDTLVTLLADYNYKYIIAVPLAIGTSNAVRAFALMIGPFFVGNWVNNQRLTYLFILQGLSIIIWSFLQHNFYFGLFGMFLTGFATTTIWSYTYAMLQQNVKPEYLGRVIAYNDMAFMISNIVTTFFIGLMTTHIGLDTITFILGTMFFIVAIYYRVYIKIKM